MSVDREASIDEALAESFPASDPPAWTLGRETPVLRVVRARVRDVAGFSVRRALPTTELRSVGPFVFFDHMGPAEGLAVRPHPHIGLATVTFLFEGAVVHRDSLGSHRVIRPGDVNWMLAGRGVVHSERAEAGAVHGIQSWVALPLDREESEPSFEHFDAAAIPHVKRQGVVADVIAGTAFGASAPTSVASPTLYAHVRMESGARLAMDDEHDEKAFYVVEGAIACGDESFEPGALVVVRAGAALEARAASRVMLLGGARLEGERHIEWNFVSSSRDRIERAKDDWRSDRFPKVPGDELERIPLP